MRHTLTVSLPQADIHQALREQLPLVEDFPPIITSLMMVERNEQTATFRVETAEFALDGEGMVIWDQETGDPVTQLYGCDCDEGESCNVPECIMGRELMGPSWWWR